MLEENSQTSKCKNLIFEERMYGKCSQEKTEKDFQAQTPQTLEKDPRPEKKEKVKRPFPGKEVLGKVFSVSG